MKLRKSDWIVIILCQTILQMCLMWCIDVSVSAMLNHGFITSGFVTSDAMFMYHVGLYGSILNLFMMGMLAVHHIVDNDKMSKCHSTTKTINNSNNNILLGVI